MAKESELLGDVALEGSHSIRARQSMLGVSALVLALIPGLSMFVTIVYGFTSKSILALFCIPLIGILTLFLGGISLILAGIASSQIKRSQGRLIGLALVRSVVVILLAVTLLGLAWGVLEWRYSAPNKIMGASMHALQAGNLDEATDLLCQAFAMDGVEERWVAIQLGNIEDAAREAGKPELYKRALDVVQTAYEEKRIIPLNEDCVFWRLKGRPSPEMP